MRIDGHIHDHGDEADYHAPSPSEVSEQAAEFLQTILNRLDTLVSQGASIMTALSDLQAKFQTLSDAITKEDSDINAAISAGQAAASALKAQITALQAQVAAGTAATPADLAALGTNVDALTANINAADAAVNAAAANLAAPPTP